MLLKADIVYRAQPHPFDACVASSGIQDVIRLWSPTSGEENAPTKSELEDILTRNHNSISSMAVLFEEDLHTWLASSSGQAETTRPSKSVRPGMSKWSKKNRAPAGFEYIQPVMDALESELREKMNEPHEGKRQCEALWPVHQINWQRSRYVYDMFYKYQKISREVYDYCIRRKLVDANLIAKWKKPGYERLCSTSAINTKNYNYGTVSICRVPRQQLSEGQMVQEKHSGCRGCASGPGGYHNIFGNKYGQYLARIQIARESKKDTEKQVWATKEEEEDAEESGKKKKRQREESSASDSSGESDSDNEEAKESEAPCEKNHKADK